MICRTNVEIESMLLGKTITNVFLDSDPWDKESSSISFKFNDGTMILLSAYEGRCLVLETPDDGDGDYYFDNW